MPSIVTETSPVSSLILPDRRVVDVQDLSVRFTTSERTVDAVRHLSFHVDRGETLAIVGESGSGKSVTSLALMRLIEHGGGRIINGQMLFRRRNGEVLDIAQARDTSMRNLRGAEIAMIFQEPMTSLNPVFTAGEQIAESIRIHQGKSAAAARAEALRMLDVVRIPEARSVLDRFPHQLSGGMRQRVMIAMALSCKPSLLIADEPTTALDVTIQAQILKLLKDLKVKYDLTTIYITHDLGVVANVADRIAVMYAGDIVEIGKCEEVFYNPRHPYTWALLSSLPQLGIKGKNLYSIKGAPPNLFAHIQGDAFAPRNPRALKIDFLERPPYFDVSPTHKARTWLLDPRAPKVDPPEIISKLRQGVSINE